MFINYVRISLEMPVSYDTLLKAITEEEREKRFKVHTELFEPFSCYLHNSLGIINNVLYFTSKQ